MPKHKSTGNEGDTRKNDRTPGIRMRSCDSLDDMSLEVEMQAIMCDPELKASEKWIHHLMAIERHAYKMDPTFKVHQFEFEAREDESGKREYVLKHPPGSCKFPRLQKFGKYWKYCKYSFSLIGPLLGAGCSVWCKS
jgi:hypothetical protein